ncbi:MAG: hypothetical protein ACYST6_19490, partial [Planctomycetota bacterium]
VTSRGRLFYIADEAPISLLGDHDLPDKWFLIARDAFNGVPLWKIPIQDWGWRVRGSPRDRVAYRSILKNDLWR